MAFNFFAQNSTEHNLVKEELLLSNFEKKELDTNQIEELFEIANQFYRNNPDTALYYCKIAQKKSQQVNYYKGIVDSYVWIGYIHWQKSELQEARQAFQDGIDMVKPTDIENQTDLLNNIGYVYKDLGDIDKGLSYFQQGLLLSISHKDSAGIKNYYNNIGLIYKDIGDYDQALFYLEKSLVIEELLKDNGGLATALNNLATIYAKRGENEKVRSYLFKSLQYSKESDDLTTVAMVLDNLGFDHQKHGDLDSALFYYEKSLLASRKIGNRYWESSTLYNLATLSIAKNNWEEAEKYSLKAYEIAQIIQFPERLRDISEQLYQINEHNKNWKQAFEYHQEFVLMRDSIGNENSRKRVFKQAINYEYQRKKMADSLNNIEQVKQFNDDIEAERIEKKQNLIWAVIGGFVLILFVLFLLRINFLRKKSNETLASKNEEIAETSKELSKALEERNVLLNEIHHRVKNNLQTISSLLSLQSRYLDDPSATKALEESQNRLLSISLLHQKLYQNKNLPIVDLGVYLKELTSQIDKTCAPTDKNISVITFCEEFTCDIELAMPLGLIVNELMTNAFKYAFVNQSQGEIKVEFNVLDKELQLKVSDNGVGVSSDFSWLNNDSMGLNLVNLLARQIKAEVEFDGKNGCTYIIQLKKK